MNRLLGVLFVLLLLSVSAFGQDYTYQTFKDTRTVNTHSVETLPAGMMDFRIVHRFGDIAGQSGGWRYTIWSRECG